MRSFGSGSGLLDFGDERPMSTEDVGDEIAELSEEGDMRNLTARVQILESQVKTLLGGK